MANMTDCMLRNLQQFVGEHLFPLVQWGEVAPRFPKDDEGNDLRDVVEIRFRMYGRDYCVRVESPEFSPLHTLGQILLDDEEVGSIDPNTWKMVADAIKADMKQDEADGHKRGD